MKQKHKKMSQNKNTKKHLKQKTKTKKQRSAIWVFPPKEISNQISFAKFGLNSLKSESRDSG